MSESIGQARREIGQAARDMLTGSLSFLEGARQIVKASFVAGLDKDPDIRPFAGIDSETDALPLGEVRRHWNAEALKRLQPKIDAAELWAKGFGSGACRNLMNRFHHGDE